MSWLLLVSLGTLPWIHAGPESRDAKLRELKGLPLAERINQISEGFLGTAYQLSPLGEGQVPDADPLIRYDAVDCLTLVEEVMALSLVENDSQVIGLLNQIRYQQGVVSWDTRNHIVEAQWVPNNLKAGFLKDVTSSLAPRFTREVSKTINKTSWREKEGQALSLDAEHQSLGVFTVNVVPAAHILKAVQQAPSGLLVLVVRADRPKGVTRVSHTGFLIQTPKGPMLRHASRSFQRAVDEPFAKYVKRNLDFAPWTIEGMAFFEIQENNRIVPVEDAGTR